MTGCLEGVPVPPAASIQMTSGSLTPWSVGRLLRYGSWKRWPVICTRRLTRTAGLEHTRAQCHRSGLSLRTEYISAVALYDASIGAVSTGSNVAHQRRRSPSTHGRSLRNSCGTPSSGEVSARSGPRFQKGVAKPLGATRPLTSLLIMSELLLKPNVILVYSSTRVENRHNLEIILLQILSSSKLGNVSW